MDLVIMAAGMGSRFGGLKQLQGIDNDNNFIIDYTIYDAMKVGFDHVVFIIKQEHFNDFKSTIGNRVEKYIDVDYVFQNTDNIPAQYKVPADRVKPFGTGHAVLCAKDKIRGDFAVVNADDFYGRDALLVAYNFLASNKDEKEYALIGYKAINTIADSGSVKRGVCIAENGYLQGLEESVIEKSNHGLVAKSLVDENKPAYSIPDNQLVSMNLFAFKHNFVNYLQSGFIDFLNQNASDLSSCEYFLPSVVSDLIRGGVARTQLLSTTSKWFGMTYKGDLDMVKGKIIEMKEQGEYPANLWG